MGAGREVAPQDSAGSKGESVTGRASSRWFGRILAALHILASYWILAILVWILADVAGRVFFSSPFPGTAEVVAYSLPLITFLQIPHVLRTRRHLRSPIFEDRLGPRGRGLFGILACLLGLSLFALAAYSSWTPMLSAWRGGEYFGEGTIRIPSGPAWTVILASCFLMAAQFLGMLIAGVRDLAKPRGMR